MAAVMAVNNVESLLSSVASVIDEPMEYQRRRQSA
jgi:hypothetical protein